MNAMFPSGGYFDDWMILFEQVDSPPARSDPSAAPRAAPLPPNRHMRRRHVPQLAVERPVVHPGHACPPLCISLPRTYPHCVHLSVAGAKVLAGAPNKVWGCSRFSTSSGPSAWACTPSYLRGY